MRRQVFTPEVIALIPTLVAADHKAESIAAHIGCNVSTLKVRCSQLKISLRTPNWKVRARVRPEPLPKAFVEDRQPKAKPVARTKPLVMQSALSLSRVARARLRQQAESVGMTDAQLATALLETIAQDDLYAAVLDREAA